MKQFMTLVAFEYKKILKRKSVQMMSLIVLFITMVSCVGILIGNIYIEGEVYTSKYDEMVKEKAYAMQLVGREIDEDLMTELVEASSQVNIEEATYGTVDYEKYIRPYAAILYIIREFYETPIVDLTKAQIQDFYSIRDAVVEEKIEATTLSISAKEQLVQLNRQVKRPFVFEYTAGYKRFMAIIQLVGIMTSFLGAIWCAPLFAGERTKKMDPIILSTKEGKTRLIGAKIFTGLSLSGGVSFILMLITYIECMLIYGADGFHAQWQICMPDSPYPITVGTVAILCAICIFCANLWSSSIILWLSAQLKKPFTVLMISSVMMIAPMMFQIPKTIPSLYRIVQLVPFNMMDVWRIMDMGGYELFGENIPPFIFLPIFAVVATAVLILLTYHNAKHHQVN